MSESTADVVTPDDTPTDDTPTATTAPSAASPDEPDEPEGEAPDDDTADPRLRKARREAKALRDRVKAAEDKANTLSTALETMQRQEVVRIATHHDGLSDGEDLFNFGATMDDLTTNGVVDQTKVAHAVNALIERKPHLASGYRSAQRLAKFPVSRAVLGASPAGTVPADGLTAFQRALGGGV
ncbi:hypothetical protein [Georgenia sp. AZ-5]|uniref:hypothetical protein n=1 Tax=Georgenia sp. AZ-5 TaxID=3367526 RepID=UPI003754AF38